MSVLRWTASAIGAAWVYAAAAKVVDPEPGYEMIATLVAGGPPARIALGAVIALEAGLGAAMLLGLVRGFACSLAMIGTLSAAAWWVSEHTGPWMRCGCLGGDGTVAEALSRNVWIAGALALLLAVDLVARRRRAPTPGRA